MPKPNLHKITDEDLTTALDSLVRRDRSVTIDVLHHLNEVERRKLHLKLGFNSLFSYCTKRLGYSESAAGRRIQTARCIRRFPQVVELLERGEVNLSTVCKVAGVALSRNEPSLLERIRGKTLDEVAAIVAEQRPAARVRDRVQPVRVAARNSLTAASEPIPLGAQVEPKPEAGTQPVNDMPPSNGACRSSTGKAANTPHHDRDSAPIEQKYRIQFVAGPEVVRALERVKSLLSFRIPADAPMETILAVVLDEFIDRHDPQRRRERRMKYRARKPGNDSAPANRLEAERLLGAATMSRHTAWRSLPLRE